MNLRSNLSVSPAGTELRTQATRKRLLADRLEHAPLAHKFRRIPARPVLVGPRHYLRALRAAEMKAWEAGLALPIQSGALENQGLRELQPESFSQDYSGFRNWVERRDGSRHSGVIRKGDVAAAAPGLEASDPI